MVKKPSIVNSQKNCPFEENILCARASVVLALKYSERPWNMKLIEYTKESQYPHLTDCMSCVYFPKKYLERMEKNEETGK